MSQKRTDRAKELIKDYNALFNTARGKRVLHDLMIQHFVIVPSYCIGDQTETAFREGQRYVVTNIMEKCKVDPEKYLNHIETIRREQNDERHIE